MPGWRQRRHAGRGDEIRPRRIRRFVEPALLLLLHCNPQHGYALIEGLNELGLEDYPVDVSAIYRVLYDLEAKGMLTSQQATEGSAGPPRRVYQLTEAGDEYLRAWIDELRVTDRLLHRFLDAYDEHQRMHDAVDPGANRLPHTSTSEQEER